MQSLIDYARTFHLRSAEALKPLGRGQWPQALFITCSDSRVVPALITGARPGELFELRTAGNAVPVYCAERPGGETATIEYAVSVLGVRDIVVCGHSHCGAVAARVLDQDLRAVPAVAGWLDRQLSDDLGGLRPDVEAGLGAAVQRHVREQLARLRDYPCVAERLETGQLRLHGWFYAVDTGLVLAHQPSADAFLPL